jgi:hypothetical protein
VDVVQRWSVRIALRAAPAEADFAAEVGVAYAAGGQARKELLPRPSVQPGAFGPGTLAAELPLILRALADAGDWLLALLRGSYLSNALAAASLIAALRAGHGGEAPAAERPAVPAATATQPPPAPPVSERQAVERAFASLRASLTTAGFTPERANWLAYVLLEELLADAAEAAVFVEALSAVPDAGARPRPSAKPKGKWARWISRP